MTSIICEGVGETRRKGKQKFFCVVKSDKIDEDYFDTREQVICSPEIREICMARVIIDKSKRLSRKMVNEKDPKIEIDTGR